MSNILTTAELETMQASVSLPDLCNILSVTRTSNGQGGFTEAWGTATANEPCRLSYRSGMETIAGGGVQPFSGWILTLPHDATITTANRVEIGAATYEVRAVDSGKSDIICVRAQVEKVV